MDDDSKFWGRRRKREKGVEKAPSVFSEMDLWRVMKNPDKSAPLTLGDVVIHAGRPDWNMMFTNVSRSHVALNVGVPFCGNPRIAKDLKQVCGKFTDLKRRTLFRLHKENF